VDAVPDREEVSSRFYSICPEQDVAYSMRGTWAMLFFDVECRATQ